MVGAIAFWAVQGLWGWTWAKITGPPGLTAYTPGPGGCVPRYHGDVPEQDPGTAEGVPITAKGYRPAELPLTLQAKTDEAIVVTGVEVEVRSSQDSPTLGTVTDPHGCGGGMNARKFDVRLTQTPVPVVAAAGSGSKAKDFPFTVSASDPKQLSLRLDPSDQDIRFSVKVEWVADGEYGSVTLDNDDAREPADRGQGYRVMGRPELP
ncbi:hypothetical protein [Streptomyces sp. NPDC047043]|uniref:hypothetical protein n=1 Tax=Streptomyces sp. NPDC047043 TaxID=3154497 RepID=UPI0033E6FBC9